MTSPADDDPAAQARTLTALVRAARAQLSAPLWDYLCGGAESEATLRRNRLAIETLALRPRVLVDVEHVSLATTLLGRPLELPVFLAPIGSLGLLTPRGVAAAGRAAERCGTTAFVSTVADLSLEELVPELRQPGVFQLYVYGDDDWLDALLARVAGHGFRALCLTLDVADYGRRERDLINRFTPRSAAARPNLGAASVTQQHFQARLDWQRLERIRARTELPLILKGIMTGEDAELAVRHGAAAVYVSNHGGRQLDHAQGTLEVLPEIVDAVAGRAEVYIDGGFCRGTDIIKALALGARAVGLGKLQGCALAAGGEAGVVRMLELLREEITTTLRLLGVADVQALDATRVTRSLLPGVQAASAPLPFDAPPSA